MKIALRALLLVLVAFVSSAGSCDSKGGDDAVGPSSISVRHVATTGNDNSACDVQACRTIGYAIGRASDGDKISVEAGSYPGNLDVLKRVTIEGADATTTTVVGAITITASLANIRKLTVLPNGSQPNGITVPNNRSVDIIETVVRGFGTSGILATSPASLAVIDSQILASGGDGVRITVGEFGAARVLGTLVSGSGDDGLQVNYGLTGTNSRRTVNIERSKFEDNATAGIQFEGWMVGTITISDNCVRGNKSEAGIYFTQSSPTELRASNNNIVSNQCGAHFESTGSTRLSLTSNWWGTAAGPAVATSCRGTNTIVGPIDVSPVLSLPAATGFSCP